MDIRQDLKTNPEYLNQIIEIQNSSIDSLKNEIQRLSSLVGDSEQSSLIELNDKIEMLNRRFFKGGSETLKSRPPRNYDRELLPHNVPPINLCDDKKVEVPEIGSINTY